MTLAIIALALCAGFIVGRAFCVGYIAERNYQPWVTQFRAEMREWKETEHAETGA